MHSVNQPHYRAVFLYPSFWFIPRRTTIKERFAKFLNSSSFFFCCFQPNGNEATIAKRPFPFCTNCCWWRGGAYSKYEWINKTEITSLQLLSRSIYKRICVSGFLLFWTYFFRFKREICAEDKKTIFYIFDLSLRFRSLNCGGETESICDGGVAG